jgi:flagellar biosynthesis/type III secretory pathway protein FliH
MVRLQDFGAGGLRSARTSAAVEGAREEAHALGFAEGYAQALEAAEAEDRAAVAQLREAVQDMELTRAAARAEAVAALRPVVEALARVAAPLAAQRGFADALAEAVEARLKGAPADRLTLRVAPDRVEGMKLRFGDRLRIAPDPLMTGAVARLEWAGGGAVYDVEDCLAAARDVIDRFFGDPEMKDPQDV